MERIDLSRFKVDATFYPEFKLMLTLKSFDQMAIRKRYLEARKSGSKQMGSVERRKVTHGGIAQVSLNEGKLNYQVLSVLPEPRGIASSGHLLAISSENKVYVLDNGKLHTIQNPWFSYIHTVDFHPNNTDRILISSSGFDCVFEYNWKTGECLREWFAWEHGFNKGLDKLTGETVLLTRSQAFADECQNKNDRFLLINKPAVQVLPTAQRAAFINSVSYNLNNPDCWLITMFHKGAVYEVGSNNEAKPVLDGMQNPHGGRSYLDGFMGTSTGSGEVFINNGSDAKVIDHRSLSGKPEGLEDLEWLQNATYQDGYFLSIDSNRNQVHVIDLKKERINSLNYPLNWAAQDLCLHVINPANVSLLKGLSVEPTDKFEGLS